MNNARNLRARLVIYVKGPALVLSGTDVEYRLLLVLGFFLACNATAILPISVPKPFCVPVLWESMKCHCDFELVS